MKKNITLLSTLALSIFSQACKSTLTKDQYKETIIQQGYLPYNHPSGNVQNPKDWAKFGPCTILRKKEQTQYESATILIGDDGVLEAMKPENSSPITLFSDQTVTGYEYSANGGWSFDAANKIAAAANLKNDKTLEIHFGPSHEASYLSESVLHQKLKGSLHKLSAACKAGLRNNTFVVVQNAIYTDSIRYTFKQTSTQGASVTYKLTNQEIASLTAKGYKVTENSIEVTQPTFIAYVPLPDVTKDIPSPKTP